MSRYRHVEVVTKDEDDLLIGLVVDDKFCQRVLPVVRDEHLKVRQYRHVLRWVREYHKKYGKAPGKELQAIFDTEAPRLNEAEAELIEMFLAALAKKHAAAKGVNWEYQIDKTRDYLRQRALEVLSEQIDVLIQRGDLDKAELLVQGHQPPNVTETDLPTVKDIRAAIGDIEWLWENWIPFGFLTLLVGDSEVGKSALALWLCGVASIRSKKKTWPDGSRKGIEKNSTCLWAETEGGLAIHEGRMKKFGFRDDSIRFFPRDLFDTLDLDDPQHIAALDACIAEYKPPLVVVDSLRGAHGGEENDSTMVGRLSRLANLAMKHKTAITVVHHLGKPKGQRSKISIHDPRGSSAIVAIARAVLAVDVPDTNYPERRRLSVIKSNLVLKPPPLGWERDGEDGRLRFDDNPPVAPRAMNAMEKAMEAITKLLRVEGEGKMEKEEIRKILLAEGHSGASIKHAGDELAALGLLHREKVWRGDKTIGIWRIASGRREHTKD